MIRLPVCALILCLFLSSMTYALDIYVSTSGNDKHPGTSDQPLATIPAALRLAREARRLHLPSIQNGIHIRVTTGTHYLYEPIFIRPEDAGTASSRTTIEGMGSEPAIISGGLVLKGWQQLSTNPSGIAPKARGKLWVVNVPEQHGSSRIIRQLWINDRKAVRAKDRNGDSMNRILRWDFETASCWIPTPTTNSLAGARDIEMLIHQWWAIAVLRVKEMKTFGDSSQLFFEEPESKIQNEHPWPAPWQSRETGNSAFTLSNALQFLDEPGEWWYDRRESKLYYLPRSGEDLRAATAVIPVQENLVNIAGAAYISFHNISFQHTTWYRPAHKGHVPLQAGMYMLDAYKLQQPGTPDKAGLENQAWIGRQPAAVELAHAHHINFQNCRFEHLAATGLDYKKNTRFDSTIGCLFRDIGGTGIQLGVFSDEAIETHLPYDPADPRELCENEVISNNLITNVTNEDWGCVGISAGCVRNVLIEHNEVNEVSYSGICVGWGWTRTVGAMRNNRVYANKVHHYAKRMYDVGGLYTLSAMPGSVLEENYIDSIYKAPYAHDPNHWFYYYLDEGSAYMTVRNNWSPSDKVMRNANGPGNTWENNGPAVAADIKRNAGLQKKYQYLLTL